ncbi:MAG: type II toxin-antitoxin system VapC family toxin [Terracidiphilus sp.]|jgi:predicted nucleic acid-binding protein
MILIDTNVLLDVWSSDPVWHAWSAGQMRQLSLLHQLAINPIIYAEVSVTFTTPASLDQKLSALELTVFGIPRGAAFLAGKAHVRYRRQGGIKGNVLPDFFIGAHAAALSCPLLTRDPRRYTTYFPTVSLITP